MFKSRMNWKISDIFREDYDSQTTVLNPAIEQLVLARQLATAESLDTFAKEETIHHDPFLFSEMSKIITRINEAIDQGEPILIYGDYDADGVTGTSILVRCLRELGALVDYYIPNRSVNDGEADANYFQHIPFFEAEVKNNGYKLVNVAGVHIEPFGFYSNEIKSIDELKDGSTIVISNSVADHGRILNILAANNLIEIKDGVNAVDATINDIAKNPKNLKFVEVKPELLTLALANNEGSLVAINGNYAIGYGLNPTKDAIILEKGDSSNPYVNILAAREDNAESDKIKALVEVLKSDEIKNFILEHYSDGSVIPAE